jgi:Right handed beta helix region
VIGLNAAGGVLIASGNGNVVRGNSIFQNNGHGIILGPGANNGATAPVLTAASYVGTSASVQGTITSTAFDRRIDFYANPVTNPGNPNPTPIPTPEGKTLIYSYTLTANDGTINPTFLTNLLAVNQFLTATITDQNGNTSALSNAIIVTNGLVVTTAADNGDNTNPILGSLRAAIINANMQTGKGQIINFVFDSYNPPVNGLWTINLASPLPDIVNPVTINGYSAAGALPNTQTTGDNAQLVVVIDSAAGKLIPDAFHFVAGADGSAVSGLVIEGFTDAGIRLSGGGGYTISGNFSGTDPTGTAKGKNLGQGVLVDGATSVTIGGANPGDRNVISGNGQGGVSIVVPTTVVIDSLSHVITPSYTVENNFIGVDSTGAAALANGGDGVVVTITGVATAPALSIFGNTHDGNGNVIGGNTGYGIRITGAAGSAPAGSGVLIAGNLIGVGSDGGPVGNGLGGVLLDAAANVTLGETGTGNGNTIGANQGDGVAVHNGNGIRITGNLLGGAAAGLGNAQDGIYVDPSSGVVITFNQMTGNAGDGVHLVAATGAKVGGNSIGVSTMGTGGPALSRLAKITCPIG